MFNQMVFFYLGISFKGAVIVWSIWLGSVKHPKKYLGMNPVVLQTP